MGETEADWMLEFGNPVFLVRVVRGNKDLSRDCRQTFQV